MSWPELTSLGRQFKLGGYTLIGNADGERPLISLRGTSEGPPRRSTSPASPDASYRSFHR